MSVNSVTGRGVRALSSDVGSAGSTDPETGPEDPVDGVEEPHTGAPQSIDFIETPPPVPKAAVPPSGGETVPGGGGGGRGPSGPQPERPAPVAGPEKPDKARLAPPIVSGYGPEVDKILNASPRLRELWEKMQKAGIKIENITKGNSRVAWEKKPPTIQINLANLNKKEGESPAETNKKLAALLAHEIGHTGITPTFLRGDTPAEFVEKNAREALYHEGVAAFENARARQEILDRGGDDIGMRGRFDAEYIGIWELYNQKPPQISEEQAKEWMAEVQSREPAELGPNGETVKTRRQEFEEFYWEELARREKEKQQ
jgi:hypothetical protein